MPQGWLRSFNVPLCCRSIFPQDPLVNSIKCLFLFSYSYSCRLDAVDLDNYLLAVPLKTGWTLWLSGDNTFPGDNVFDSTIHSVNTQKHRGSPPNFLTWTHTGDLWSNTYIMQFVVKATGVAHRISARVAPPECGGGRLTVGAACARSSGRRLEEYKEWP